MAMQLYHILAGVGSRRQHAQQQHLNAALASQFWPQYLAVLKLFGSL